MAPTRAGPQTTTVRLHREGLNQDFRIGTTCFNENNMECSFTEQALNGGTLGSICWLLERLRCTVITRSAPKLYNSLVPMMLCWYHRSLGPNNRESLWHPRVVASHADLSAPPACSPENPSLLRHRLWRGGRRVPVLHAGPQSILRWRAGVSQCLG